MCCSVTSGQRPWRGLPSCLRGGCGEKVAQHQKQKSKSVSVLHGCQRLKRLSFQRSASQGLTQWHGDCSHSSTPRLLGRVYTAPAFWPGLPWKNEFPPQCTTMLREAGARARACCDVNLMTSCCSDGWSKQLNKGIVVFLLHFVGKGPLRLSYRSLLGNSGASVSTVEYNAAS